MAIDETDDAFAPLMRDTADLPYRVKTRGLELFYVIMICGLGLVAGGVISALGLAGKDSTPQWISILALAAAAGSAWRLWLLPTPYLILYPDRLEKRGLTGWRTLRRSDIKGVKSAGSDRAGKLLEVVPRQDDLRGVQLRAAVRDDPVVKRWFAGVRDLTAEELEADRLAVLSDSRYGANEAQRAARLKRAKTMVVAFSAACLAVGAWMLFLSPPYQTQLAAAILAVLAGVVLVQTSDGLIVWASVGKARPAALAALAPAAAAAYHGLALHILGNQPLIWAAVIGGALLTLLWAQRSQPAFDWRPLLGILWFAGFGIYGLSAMADVALAPSGSKIFPLRVVEKYESGSRYTSYNLKVGAWSDQHGGGISVPSEYYSKVQIGSAVCIYRRPGALGLDWVEVKDCPAGIQLPPPLDMAAQTASAPAAKPPSDYPEAALRAGKEGKAMVKCTVVDDERLTDCQVLSEIPAGFGFGAMAVDMLSTGKIRPSPAQLKGHVLVSVPVAFKLAQ